LFFFSAIWIVGDTNLEPTTAIRHRPTFQVDKTNGWRGGI
jgi:hypothetical protein